MIKVSSFKKVLFNLRNFSSRKTVKYICYVVDVVILISVLIFIFSPDPIINSFIKKKIAKAFTEAYPAITLKLGDMHYNIWKNRLGCDSIQLKSNDSSFTISSASFSIGGIGWLKLLKQREFSFNTLANYKIDVQKIKYTFNHLQDELRIREIHISIPDSEMTTDSIKYYSLMGDEQLFAKSKFRQTRFRFDISKMKIRGLDFVSLLKGERYNAKSILVYDLDTDILVNMDKPYNKNSPKPQMPNELLSSMKEIVKIDSLKIVNGRLKYCERYVVHAKPGVITFHKVNISVTGIANHTAYPDTTFVHGDGVFMNSGTMKLFMAIPLKSNKFSLHYSGSLSKMDLTKLNSFLEPGEHHRIKSGILNSAAFDINVHSGFSNGSLRVVYKDLSIAILNKETGSEKGIFNRIFSFFGKVFVIRGSNEPDSKGQIKIGKIKYNRDPEDYFLQFLWFSLRNGIADVVGFPSK